MTNKPKKPSVTTNKDGSVSRNALRERHAARSPTARKIDDGRIAKIVYPKTLSQAEATHWMEHPNRCDVEGIDTGLSHSNEVPKKSHTTKKKIRSDVIEKKMSTPNKTDSDFINNHIIVAGTPLIKNEPKTLVHARHKKIQQSNNGYSHSWYDSLPWTTDPQQAAEMAIEALNVEKTELNEDMMPYLVDSGYEEIAKNNRWKYDDRETIKAYRNKMWEREKMLEPSYSIKSRFSLRGLLTGRRRY